MGRRKRGFRSAMRQTRVVARWTCPRCDRQFGSARQAHVCAPGVTVEQLLSRHPAWVGAVYAEVIAQLHTLGPVHEDAVDVGVFLKSDRTLAEFRPKVRSVQLWLLLPKAKSGPPVIRTTPVAADRVANVIGLTRPDQVDGLVRDWLSEAYDFATD